MEKKYEFIIPGVVSGVDAETAAQELDRIKDEYGVLTPELVVMESRSEDAVLHRCFVWDDAEAAEKWRREQARKLIGNLRIIIKHEKVEYSVRAFVNVRPAEGVSRSFVPLTEVIHNKDAYDDLLAQAKTDMESFVLKYSQIEELNAVKAEMLKANALL